MVNTTNATPKLYHPDVFLPKGLRFADHDIPLSYSHHAREAARSDRYGNIEHVLPASINPTKAKLVEVEVTGQRVTKIVLRLSVAENLDLAVVFVPGGFVKTTWGCVKNDSHRTLDRSRYATA